MGAVIEFLEIETEEYYEERSRIKRTGEYTSETVYDVVGGPFLKLTYYYKVYTYCDRCGGWDLWDVSKVKDQAFYHDEVLPKEFGCLSCTFMMIPIIGWAGYILERAAPRKVKRTTSGNYCPNCGYLSIHTSGKNPMDKSVEEAKKQNAYPYRYKVTEKPLPIETDLQAKESQAYDKVNLFISNSSEWSAATKFTTESEEKKKLYSQSLSLRLTAPDQFPLPKKSWIDSKSNGTETEGYWTIPPNTEVRDANNHWFLQNTGNQATAKPWYRTPGFYLLAMIFLPPVWPFLIFTDKDMDFFAKVIALISLIGMISLVVLGSLYLFLAMN